MPMTVMSAAFSLICLIIAALHLVRLAVLRDDVVGEASHAAMGVGMAAMFSPLGDPVPRLMWTAVFAVCAGWFTVLLLRGRHRKYSTVLDGPAPRWLYRRTGQVRPVRGPSSGPQSENLDPPITAPHFRCRPPSRREAAARHHVVGSAAMLFMIGAGTHAGHDAPAGGFGLGSVAAIVLAGYFAWYALGCLDRVTPRAVERPAGEGFVPGAGIPVDASRGEASSSYRALFPGLVVSSGGGVALRPACTGDRAAAGAHLVLAVAMSVMLLGMV
jgi:Domain of unknown function (DUF5134)